MELYTDRIQKELVEQIKQAIYMMSLIDYQKRYFQMLIKK